MRSLFLTLLAALLTASPLTHAEEEVKFSDVPEDHFAHGAIYFLQKNGILNGYDDGTFRPNTLVNRAEAVKIIVSPLITANQLKTAKTAKSTYTDVADDAWFKPYVELARVSNIIDGPPKKTEFKGGDPVIKAEFLKIVQTAFGADPHGAFSEIVLPLSTDIADTDAWFYPYFRYGIASSMTMVSKDGTLDPGREITRAEAAVLLYRFIMYNDNRRNQALLSVAENEILIVIALLNEKNLVQAEYASARALLAARGAHLSKPNEGIVKGAVKVTEAFRALVRAYKAGTAEFYDETIRLAGEAWNLGARGKEFAPELSDISDQVQSIAKNIADNAREQKAKEEGDEGEEDGESEE